MGLVVVLFAIYEFAVSGKQLANSNGGGRNARAAIAVPNVTQPARPDPTRTNADRRH